MSDPKDTRAPNDPRDLKDPRATPFTAKPIEDGAIVATEPDDVGIVAASSLEAVLDVPVRVSAVLGRTRMAVSELLSINVGTVLELDRKVGEAIDVFVNDRLVARGEVVLVEDRLGVTMTEIIRSEK